jgi:hypothetical protein
MSAASSGYAFLPGKIASNFRKWRFYLKYLSGAEKSVIV